MIYRKITITDHQAARNIKEQMQANGIHAGRIEPLEVGGPYMLMYGTCSDYELDVAYRIIRENLKARGKR